MNTELLKEILKPNERTHEIQAEAVELTRQAQREAEAIGRSNLQAGITPEAESQFLFKLEKELNDSAYHAARSALDAGKD